MQTSGRPGRDGKHGCHYAHMQNMLLLRTAGNEVIQIKFDPKGRHIHRVDTEHKEGTCRLCSIKLSEDRSADGYPLPPGYVATSLMQKYFNVRKPLCFSCANGKAVVIGSNQERLSVRY